MTLANTTHLPSSTIDKLREYVVWWEGLGLNIPDIKIMPSVMEYRLPGEPPKVQVTVWQWHYMKSEVVGPQLEWDFVIKTMTPELKELIEKASELEEKVTVGDINPKHLANLYDLAVTLTRWFDSNVPFDPTKYSQEIEDILNALERKEENAAYVIHESYQQAEVRRIIGGIQLLHYMGDAKPPKLKPSLPTATVLVFFVSMLVSAALTFYLLKP